MPHIFVVFNGGSGGNFLAGILNEVLNSTLKNLDISSSGSSHTVLRDKSKGTDLLSFGTLLDEHSYFKSDADREAYYVENIAATYSSANRPEIIWSHDFTNIPYYRKHFKNAKILVITTTTPNEQLTALFMLVIKVFLDKNCLLPITPDMWSIFINRWIDKCTNMLRTFMGQDSAHKIMADRYNPMYRDILLYATMTMFLKVRQMLHLVDTSTNQEVLLSYTLPSFNLKIENNLDSYIDDECIVLPYSYLANNNIDLLIEKISAILARNLKDNEVNYITSSFNQYRVVQDISILTNPVSYYKELRHRVLNKTYDEN